MIDIRWRKFLPGENTRMVVIAVFIGFAAGGANIFFRTVTEAVHEMIFVGGMDFFGISRGGWRLVFLPLLPMAGMVLLIPLSLLFPGQVNGYGFTGFLRKVNLEGGILRARTILLKIFSTALTVGTGGSAGVEGPIAQVGGAIGSQVGQFFRVSGDRMKVYIAAGSAGGIAAMFNAPIAGVFFASEIVLLGTYEFSSFAVLVISSAMATVVSRAWFGAVPAFPVPEYHMVSSLAEIPLYVVMGVVVGLAAVLHIYFFYLVRDRFQALGLHPQVKPVLGAFLVGSMGIFLPQVMGDGYGFIESVLMGGGVFWLVALLVFAKILATAITLGAGGAGGVFAPALFIGAMVGGGFGMAVNTLFPGMTASSGAYAVVGIGAFLAACTHAPLTGIFLLFEMTGNYLIIIPVMVTSIIGTAVASFFLKDSIDTVDFSREGIDIHEGREMALLKSIRVGQAMSEDVDFISEKANANHLLEIFRQAQGSFYFPVINEQGRMTGMVSLQDVKGILHDEEKRLHSKVGDICARNVIMLTPDDTLYTAMNLFDLKGLEEIPVVESLEDPWVVGKLKHKDAHFIYNREMLKRGMASATRTAGGAGVPTGAADAAIRGTRS